MRDAPRSAAIAVVFAALTLSGCARAPRQMRVGCGPDAIGVRRRLAMAGEQPWCDDDSAPREAYRLVWGLPQLPVVATVRIEGDSARVHVFAAEIQDSVGYVYPARDTTYVVPRSWITVTILGEDWRPGEPSSSGFNVTLWKSEHIDPQPAGGQRPILELESILHGRYHASVRWNAVSLLDPFGRTAYELAKLGIADQHIFVQDPHARRT